MQRGPFLNSLGSIAFWTSQQAGETLLVQYGGTNFYLGGSIEPFEIVRTVGDVCEFPEDIAGDGTFTMLFENTSASGFTGTCAGPLATEKDHYYRWTAPSSGDFQFRSIIPQIVPHSRHHLTLFAGGDCNAPCLLSRTGSTGPSFEAVADLIGVTAGEEFLIRIGSSYPWQWGTLEITTGACTTPDAFEPNDILEFGAVITPGLYTDLNLVQGGDTDYYRFLLQPGEAAYANITSTNGTQVVMRRYGHILPQPLDIPPGLGPAEPLLVNIDGVPGYFALGVTIAPGQTQGCAVYELDLRVAQDPCGFPGEPSPPSTWLEPGLYPGLQLSRAEHLSYDMVVGANRTLQLDFLPGISSPNLEAMLEVPQGIEVVGNSNGVSWTNPFPNPSRVRLRMNLRTPPGLEYLNECESYDLRVSGGLGLGTPYCGPAIPNTTGQSGIIQAQGQANPSANEFTLVGRQLPRFEFVFFLGSQTQAFVPLAGGSSGNLCVGGAVVRFNSQAGQIPPSGVFARTIDLSNVPEPPFFNTMVQSGQTWNFLLWHRDSVLGPTSNFTNGVAVTFQ